MLINRALFTLAACAVFLLTQHDANAQFYVVSQVGAMPQGPEPTWAWDINDAGAVIGVAHVNGSRASECLLVDDGATTTFASDQGHPFIWPGAINNTTTFVGTQMVTVPIGTKRESFIGGPEFLPDLFPQFPSGDASHGRDINNNSPPWGAGVQRLGDTIGIGGFSVFRGYLVLLDGNPNPPVAMPALGGTFSAAEALNDLRDVVGGSLTTSGPMRAFLRPGSGSATVNLGTLGGTHSCATDINNARQVVGWSRVADGGTRAFLYQNSTMTSLGALGGTLSEARGINEAGRIVGMSFNAQAKPRAFLYRNGAMVDLNTRIRDDSGWTLQTARAINETGAIVGWGRFQSETRGFLLTPRRPGDATLDGVVDVDDIIAVIIGWGACGSPLVPCAADVAPQPEGDGQINVDDLIMVILNWG